MTKLSQHGDFPEDLLNEAKAQLNGELEFAEQEEPLARNGEGYPSFGDFIEAHFDFRDRMSYPAPYSNEEMRRLKDELGIVRSEIAKGYEGAQEKAARIRAKMTDHVRQNYTNLQAAYAGTNENQPVIDSRDLLVAEKEQGEKKIGKLGKPKDPKSDEMIAAYEAYQKGLYKQATWGQGMLPENNSK